MAKFHLFSLKKAAAALAAFSCMFLCLCTPVSASGFTAPFEPECEAAYIVNLETNIVVYAKNERTPVSAASLTKLVTVALTYLTYGNDLDTPELTASSYLFDYVYGKDASTADIRQNEVLSPRSLIYAMMLPSANEAAYIAAAGICQDDVDGFVYMMNTFVSNIGCTDTVFYDPCGLDERNVTTARDMYLVLRYLLMSEWAEDFAEVCSTGTYYMPANLKHAQPYLIINTDKMIDASLGGLFYRSYTKGGKTGSLDEWQNFAGWHEQDDMSYISVVLHSPNTADLTGYPTNRPALYETGELMDWVFDNFSIQATLDTGDPITEVPVKYSSETDTLLLYPADELQTILPSDGDGTVTQKIFNLPDSVAAPVKQGDVVGSVTVTLQGREIGTVDLLAGRDVSRNDVLYFIGKAKEFASDALVPILAVTALVILLIVLFATRSARRQRSKLGSRRHFREDR